MQLSGEEKLKSSVFFIEATGYERLMIWKEYHEKVMWEEDREGFWTQVGQIGKNKPVCASFCFAEILGQRICFYEPTSRYVDHEMIEKYIEKTCHPKKWDHNSRRAFTNAMNFHIAVAACEEKMTKETAKDLAKRMKLKVDDNQGSFN